MAKNAQRLLADALQLPEPQRVRLAEDLLASIDATALAEDRAWLDESERRSRAALAGEPGIPWSAARAEIEARLKR